MQASQALAERWRGNILCPGATAVVATDHDARNARMVFVHGVKRQLVVYPEADQHGDRHADGDSAAVDDGIALVFNQVPETDLEVAFIHTELVCVAVGLRRTNDAGTEKQ